MYTMVERKKHFDKYGQYEMNKQFTVDMINVLTVNCL